MTLRALAKWWIALALAAWLMARTASAQAAYGCYRYDLGRGPGATRLCFTATGSVWQTACIAGSRVSRFAATAPS